MNIKMFHMAGVWTAFKSKYQDLDATKGLFSNLKNLHNFQKICHHHVPEHYRHQDLRRYNHITDGLTGNIQSGTKLACKPALPGTQLMISKIWLTCGHCSFSENKTGLNSKEGFSRTFSFSHMHTHSYTQV